jgi:FkbM family methyltransferase
VGLLSHLKFALKVMLPPKIFIRFLAWKRGYPEPELKLIKILSDKNKISIDVGASEGLYTAHLFLNSKKCISFEPRIEASIELAKLTAGLNPPVQIETVALSDFTGEAQLKIFVDDAGRSTIEKNNLIENQGQIEIVPTIVKKLDDYDFNDVIGFIKIDVEGQEEAVLRGAEKLLKRDSPILMVEIEERHKFNSIKNVSEYLGSLSYSGFFLQNDHLVSLNNFSVYEHQDINKLNLKGEYINNFIFITNGKKNNIKKLLK